MPDIKEAYTVVARDPMESDHSRRSFWPRLRASSYWIGGTGIRSDP
jgi:hypothetical protein